MRRTFRHPFRRGFTPDIPPMLQRANELLAIGDYPAAAQAFEQLARAALARRGPRAPMFFLQAGRARILNGQAALGVEHLKQGLSILASLRQWPLLHRTGQRVIMELNERGLTAEAKEIEALLENNLPAGFTPSPHSRDRPPANPSCPRTVPPAARRRGRMKWNGWMRSRQSAPIAAALCVKKESDCHLQTCEICQMLCS